MNHRPGTSYDIRDAPAYSFLEASRYLGVPQATLRYWVLGRTHRKEPELAVSEPLIRAPSGSRNRISFNNLVEAYVLRALRPTVAGSGVSTGALVQRIDAGETVDALAWDYGLEIAQIEDAVLYEGA